MSSRSPLPAIRRALVLFAPFVVACSSSQGEATTGTDQNLTHTVVGRHTLNCVFQDSTDPGEGFSVPLKITDVTEGPKFREALQVGQFVAPIDIPFAADARKSGSLKKGEPVGPDLFREDEAFVGYGNTRAEAWTQVFEGNMNSAVGIEPPGDAVDPTEYSLKIMPFNLFDREASAAVEPVTVQIGVTKTAVDVTFTPIKTYTGTCQVAE